jgi:hypothetical protein
VQKIQQLASRETAGGGSAMSELSDSSRLYSAKPIGGCRQSVLVFVMVLLPVPLASILFASTSPATLSAKSYSAIDNG